MNLRTRHVVSILVLFMHLLFAFGSVGGEEVSSSDVLDDLNKRSSFKIANYTIFPTKEDEITAFEITERIEGKVREHNRNKKSLDLRGILHITDYKNNWKLQFKAKVRYVQNKDGEWAYKDIREGRRISKKNIH